MKKFGEDATKSVIRVWSRDLILAGIFLTRLPFKIRGEFALGELANAGWAFPVIGIITGTIAGIIYLIVFKLGFDPLVCGVLAILTSIIVTGGLHEDGLADTFDGLGGGTDCESKLQIMRDSSIGTFGVIAVIFSMLVRSLVLANLLEPKLAVIALISAGSMSRSVLPFFTNILSCIRKDGLAVDTGRAELRPALISLAVGFLISMICLGVVHTFLIVLVTFVIVGFFAILVYRQLGGYTGDILGACQQVAEITALLVIGVVIK